MHITHCGYGDAGNQIPSHTTGLLSGMTGNQSYYLPFLPTLIGDAFLLVVSAGALTSSSFVTGHLD